MTLVSEVRVGSLEDPLESVLSKYSPGFVHVPIGLPGTKKQVLVVSEPAGNQFLLVSQTDYRNVKVLGYNVMVTAGGPLRDELVLCLEDFSRKTGIALREASSAVRRMHAECDDISRIIRGRSGRF